MSDTKRTFAENAQAAIARTILNYAQGNDPDVQLPKILHAVDTLVPTTTSSSSGHCSIRSSTTPTTTGWCF